VNRCTPVSSVWVVMAGSQIGNRLVAKTSSMVRKSSKTAGKPRPKRPPIRLGEIKTGRIVNRLRELHELGGDPAYERFPASEGLSSCWITYRRGLAS
jgi:hypothetical protein